MEPTNHPFRKETDLPNLHEDMFQPLIFRGVINAGNMAASLPELVANQLEAGGSQNDGPQKAGNFPFEKYKTWRCLPGGGFIFFNVHPYLGKIPILTNILQKGLKPPTSLVTMLDVRGVGFFFPDG